MFACAFGAADAYPYRSPAGHAYRYDLSRPADRVRYEADPVARLRDSVDPIGEIDRAVTPGRDLRDRKLED